ncbi:UvrD-helicase domain-containing protein [Methanomethylovorans sp.]|uniref:UvrD-helicase domain-containing protein n=1 Tax=Methanomethylovorans sp. TaxID=2758717 RepID=UPI001BD4ACE1|nr:UvrD-helicase domain-containing protein [Methanomethylovorans sp.]
MENNLMITILDEDIKYAERIFLPKGTSFDTERVTVIKCMESKDIQACPGSGKTTTLLAKLAILAQKMPLEGNKGICVLTHTNVAINEIKDKLGSKGKVLFEYPNFFGTIQSFVDKFLSIPEYIELFGTKPYIIDDEVYNEIIYKKYLCLNYGTKLWVDKRSNPVKFIQSIRFSFSNPEDLVNIGNLKDKTKVTYKNLYGLKYDMLKTGVLCYDDAYALASWYIHNYEELLTKLFSERFAFVFIDEMQDTGNYQNELLDLIFDDSKMIIQKYGDLNQSIYYEGAANEEDYWNVNESCLCINGSKRFSNKIASCVKHFCLIPQEIIGNNSVKDIPPIVIIYDENSIENVIPLFSKIIVEKGLQTEKNVFKAVGWVAQIKDGKRTIPSYFPSYQKKQKDIPNHETLRDYIKKVSDERISIKGVNYYRKSIVEALIKILRECNIKNENSRYFTVNSFFNYLKEKDNHLYEQFNLLLAKWCLDIHNGIDIRDELQNFIETDFIRIFNIRNIDRLKPFIENEPTIETEEYCESKPNIYEDNSGLEIEIATVHSVKGETHSATLYLETYYNKYYDVQRTLNYLQKERCSPNSLESTSLKMCFVGMTRPTHLLCVAVHQDGVKDKIDYLQRNGWEIRYIEEGVQQR